MSFNIVIKNLETGETKDFVFGSETVLLGRSKICDVSLQDGVLSRQHCSLTQKTKDTVELEDLKSANGTVYNGQKISRESLTEGSVFQLGHHEVRIAKIELPKIIDSEDLTPVSTDITVVPEPIVEVKQPKPKSAAPVEKQKVVEFKPVQKPAQTDDDLTLKTPVFLKSPQGTLHQTKEWVQVSLLWKDSLVDLKCFDRGDLVTIGEAATNDFQISLASLPQSFKFLKILPTGVEINLHPAMKGLVETKDQVLDLDQLRSQARGGRMALIQFQDRCLIEFGPFAFYIKTTRLSLTAPLTAPLVKDPLFTSIAAGCFLFFTLFLSGLSGLTPPLEEPVEKQPENVVSLAEPTESPMIKPPPPPPPPPPPKQAKSGEVRSEKQKLGGQEGAGAKATGEQGKTGRKTGTIAARARPVGMVTESDKPIRGVPKGALGKETDPTKAKAGKRADEGVGSGTPKPRGSGTQAPSKSIKPQVRVEDMGISGVLSGRGGGGQAADGGALSGTGLGGNLEGSLEGLERGDDINVKGSGGRGAKGLGLGGGGSSIEVGGLSTKGKGGGQSGFGLGSSGKKGDAEVSYSAEDVEVRDGLTREEIERVVRQNEQDIQTCYEQSLIQGGQNLTGRIKVSWFVNRDGRVERVSQESGIAGGDSLYQCIASKLSRWQFPQPRGGSGAQVSWPWVFRKGG